MRRAEDQTELIYQWRSALLRKSRGWDGKEKSVRLREAQRTSTQVSPSGPRTSVKGAMAKLFVLAAALPPLLLDVTAMELWECAA